MVVVVVIELVYEIAGITPKTKVGVLVVVVVVVKRLSAAAASLLVRVACSRLGMCVAVSGRGRGSQCMQGDVGRLALVVGGNLGGIVRHLLPGAG